MRPRRGNENMDDPPIEIGDGKARKLQSVAMMEERLISALWTYLSIHSMAVSRTIFATESPPLICLAQRGGRGGTPPRPAQQGEQGQQVGQGEEELVGEPGAGGLELELQGGG